MHDWSRAALGAAGRVDAAKAPHLQNSALTFAIEPVRFLLFAAPTQ